jgi:hypothetical protein
MIFEDKNCRSLARFVSFDILCAGMVYFLPPSDRFLKEKTSLREISRKNVKFVAR